MLPITDETIVDTAARAASKQHIETTQVEATTLSEPAKPPVEVEEIHTEQASIGMVQAKRHVAEKEEDPNPLLLDPYDFDRCTITIVYTRVGDQQASISVHNHKDDPLVKTFPLVDVPLPEQIACELRSYWKYGLTEKFLPQWFSCRRRMSPNAGWWFRFAQGTIPPRKSLSAVSFQLPLIAGFVPAKSVSRSIARRQPTVKLCAA